MGTESQALGTRYIHTYNIVSLLPLLSVQKNKTKNYRDPILWSVKICICVNKALGSARAAWRVNLASSHALILHSLAFMYVVGG